MARLPRQQLLAKPLRAFLSMAEQASVRTFLLTKSQSHLSVGDVIYLMGPGFEQERIHDARHVARNTTAALGVDAMARMRCNRGVVLKVGVASYTHQIRLVPEFHGRRIRGRLVAVRIVAGTAAHLSFSETLRTLERLDDERRLAKSAVLIETLAGEISKRDPETLGEEMVGGQIIQFAGRARRTNCRLHVALRTNAYEIMMANITEIHRRIERLLRLMIAHRQVHDMLQRGAMAHLTINARLLELQIVRLKTSALLIA